MAALVTDVVIHALDPNLRDPEYVVFATELSEALHEGGRRGLADNPDAYWCWIAAIEASLAFSIDSPVEARKRRRRAFSALHKARYGDDAFALLPARDISLTPIEDFWKVNLGAQALAIVKLLGRRLSDGQRFDDLCAICEIGSTYGSSSLERAARSVASEIGLELPPCTAAPVEASQSKSRAPWEVAADLIRTGRPDVCESALKRGVVAELTQLGGCEGPDALRAAYLHEDLAIYDAWPFLAGGPPEGWGSVRQHTLFDSHFYRAAAVGAGRRTGELPWFNLEECVASSALTIWMRELDADLSTVSVVAHCPDVGWTSRVERLNNNQQSALANLLAGRVHALTRSDLDSLGRTLVEPILGQLTAPLLTAYVPSPRLRNLPIEALRIGSRWVAENVLVTTTPSVIAMMRPPAAEKAPSGHLRILGMFDSSLDGARSEIDALRDLVRSGWADGIGYAGPAGVKEQLAAGGWDVLAIATHGSVRGGVPILETPAKDVALPTMLSWRLPPIVSFAACRTGEASAASVPLEWMTVALRRGARLAIAARWEIPDKSTARIMNRFYKKLAEDRSGYASVSFWKAVAEERRRNDHPWYWAGLGLFGDFGARPADVAGHVSAPVNT